MIILISCCFPFLKETSIYKKTKNIIADSPQQLKRTLPLKKVRVSELISVRKWTDEKVQHQWYKKLTFLNPLCSSGVVDCVLATKTRLYRYIYI